MMKSNSLIILFWGSLSVAPMCIFAAANNVNNQIENLEKKPDAGIAAQVLRSNAPVHQDSVQEEDSRQELSSSEDDCIPHLNEEGYWFLVFAGCVLATRGKP